MIKFKKSKFPEVTVYNPEGKVVAAVNNEFDLDQVRLQIAQERLEGYYLEYEGGERIDIVKYASLSDYPEEIMEHNYLLRDLIKAQMEWRLNDRQEK